MIRESTAVADCLIVRETSTGGADYRTTWLLTVATLAAFSPCSATATYSSFPHLSTSISGDHSAVETAERLLVISEVVRDQFTVNCCPESIATCVPSGAINSSSELLRRFGRSLPKKFVVRMIVCRGLVPLFKTSSKAERSQVGVSDRSGEVNSGCRKPPHISLLKCVENSLASAGLTVCSFYCGEYEALSKSPSFST